MAVKEFDELDKKLIKNFQRTRESMSEEDEVDLDTKRDESEGIICPKNISQSGIDMNLSAFEYLLASIGFSEHITEAELKNNIEQVKKESQNHFYLNNEVEILKYKIKMNNQPVEIIDQIKVYSDDTSEEFLGDTANTGLSEIVVYGDVIDENSKALSSFIWAKMKIRFNKGSEDEDAHYVITELTPLSIDNLEIFKKQYKQILTELKFEEKIDLLLRSIGLEPDKPKLKEKFSENNTVNNLRAKMHLITRLIPFVENNYNLMEIGEKGIGKSYLQKLSPTTISHPASNVSYADLFGDNRFSKNNAEVGKFDVVFIDEISKGNFKDSKIIEKMNGYLTDGFYTAKDNATKKVINAKTSFVFTGNNNKSIGSLLRRKMYNLFTPCPDSIENDVTVQDRINYYIPSWELEEFPNDIQTDHLGITVDFLFKLFSDLRNEDYTNILKENGLEPHENVTPRDRDAINKTVSGLVKLLNISSEKVKIDELERFLNWAIEGRNRVIFQKNYLKSYEEDQIIYKDTSSNREIKSFPLELNIIKKENKFRIKSQEVDLISPKKMKDFNLELFENLMGKLHDTETKTISVDSKEFFKLKFLNYNFRMKVVKQVDSLIISIPFENKNPEPSPHIGQLFKKVSAASNVKTNSHILDSYIKTYTFIRDKLIELRKTHPKLQKDLKLSKHHYSILEKGDYQKLRFEPYINQDIKLEIGYEYNRFNNEVLSCNYGGINIEVSWQLDLSRKSRGRVGSRGRITRNRRYKKPDRSHSFNNNFNVRCSLNRGISNYI
jgi:ATP-dependent Lon protease